MIRVLTALRLYEKHELTQIVSMLKKYNEALKKTMSKYGAIEMPGYTHMQKAMPASASMWLSCFIDSNADNIELIEATLKLIDKSPLGTAAGFGVPVLKIKRSQTTKELDFSEVQQKSNVCAVKPWKI